MQCWATLSSVMYDDYFIMYAYVCIITGSVMISFWFRASNMWFEHLIDRSGCHTWSMVCWIYPEHLVPIPILIITSCPFCITLEFLLVNASCFLPHEELVYLYSIHIIFSISFLQFAVDFEATVLSPGCHTSCTTWTKRISQKYKWNKKSISQEFCAQEWNKTRWWTDRFENCPIYISCSGKFIINIVNKP